MTIRAPALAHQDQPGTENLAGLVERIRFHNPENGYCVLRVKVRGQRDLVTVICHAALISAGEFVQAAGTWTNDVRHGQQFKASFLKVTAPTTIEGIGETYAKRLVKAFSGIVFDVIEQQPGRLREIDGIGPKRAERIVSGWAEQKVVRDHWLVDHNDVRSRMRSIHVAGFAEGH